MLKRDYAFLMVGIEALAVVGVVYYLVMLDFMSLAWSASIAVALPAWVLAVKAPTTCGVTTQTGGRCSRPVNGVIFGCGRSNHTWAKFFSRFGWRRQSDPNASGARPGRLTNGADGVDVVMVKIAEDWKSTAAFWLAMAATLCAITSATVDATNFARDRQHPTPTAATPSR
ncbi:hypothetical protein DFJ67_3497 [Asanoa ferruginea]|uniref:Uncharacterized protein n=1 Tax=Asanoa ferruginea TaxID=53367 RepID=A0A3D9ZJ83_9ACTN|nr:hypothetical protein [Asanoa ferruginea]REF97496.1 hypothetical protein DFJ67_3497 [Asanoa ferruginea]GIF48216.1 hypothetical protein Afe04nite_27550 [Asanoa ferruginea]